MREPTGRRDRLSIRLPAGRDLIDETVPLLQRNVGRAGEVGPDVGTVHGFFARDPAAPGHRTPGTVHLRAVETRERTDYLTVVRHFRRRRTTARIRVVRRAGAKCRHRTVDLVVSNEQHVAVRSRERSHSVVPPGEHGPVVEHDRWRGKAGAGNQRVGVVKRAVLEAAGRWSRIRPSLKSATGPRTSGRGFAAAASAKTVFSDDPPTTTPPVVASAPRRNSRRPKRDIEHPQTKTGRPSSSSLPQSASVRNR